LDKKLTRYEGPERLVYVASIHIKYDDTVSSLCYAVEFTKKETEKYVSCWIGFHYLGIENVMHYAEMPGRRSSNF